MTPSNPLAAPLVDLLPLLRDVQRERDAYKSLAQAGIHYAHGQHHEIGRLRRSNQMLRDEMRARLLTESAA